MSQSDWHTHCEIQCKYIGNAALCAITAVGTTHYQMTYWGVFVQNWLSYGTGWSMFPLLPVKYVPNWSQCSAIWSNIVVVCSSCQVVCLLSSSGVDDVPYGGMGCCLWCCWGEVFACRAWRMRDDIRSVCKIEQLGVFCFLKICSITTLVGLNWTIWPVMCSDYWSVYPTFCSLSLMF